MVFLVTKQEAGHGGRSSGQGAGRSGPQYTGLLRIPQHSTMLKIISKICRTKTRVSTVPDGHRGAGPAEHEEPVGAGHVTRARSCLQPDC